MSSDTHASPHGGVLARIVRALRTLRADRRGVSAIEFGITVPVLVIIVLGTYDLGNIVQQRIKLADAVHAGGHYAVSYPASSTGMTNAITATLPSGWTDVTISAPVLSCACWTAGGGAAAASCGNDPVCPSGSITERYVTLTATRPYTPLFMVGFTSVSSSYVARVQ